MGAYFGSLVPLAARQCEQHWPSAWLLGGSGGCNCRDDFCPFPREARDPCWKEDGIICQASLCEFQLDSRSYLFISISFKFIHVLCSCCNIAQIWHCFFSQQPPPRWQKVVNRALRPTRWVVRGAESDIVTKNVDILCRFLFRRNPPFLCGERSSIMDCPPAR